MKQAMILVATMTLVALSIPGCLEDKLLDVVLTGETYADFSEDETGTDVPETAIVDVGDQIRDILEENDYSTSEIEDAFVTSVFYGVTSFDQSHDWVLTGAISVRRLDPVPGGFVPIVNYSAQSVQAALGQKIPAQLEQSGVDVVNQAMDDFLAGQNPVLEFQLFHGTIAPTPSLVDPMVFSWRAWLSIQLITTQTVEVPDPF